MKVLRIKAKSLTDALAEARRQLGDGATVLHTKQCDDSVLFGLGRRQAVEALVAVDTGEPEYAGGTVVVAADDNLGEIARQISDIRHIIARFDAGRGPVQAHLHRSPVLDRLVRNGVSETIAGTLVSDSDDPVRVMENVRRRIKCAGPAECSQGQSRVAIVGPTGAGKTTTAAKLAAQYTLVHKKKVALLTLDTYRVGAVEQLATYARILDAPLEVALCPEDVEPLVEKHRDKDLIIIDTVGRSQRDKANLEELARLLRPASPTEVHLAVSAQASPAAQKEAVDAFRPLHVSRLIMTKLDECPQPGCLLDLAANSLLPFSYVTFGQEVPDDIAAADAERLAKLVWEGSL